MAGKNLSPGIIEIVFVIFLTCQFIFPDTSKKTLKMIHLGTRGKAEQNSGKMMPDLEI